MNHVISDLALGVRLAVGGSRKSWGRLALQGVGIGLCVAMLLLAAALPNALDARDDRGDARSKVTEGAGPAPVLEEEMYVHFRSRDIPGTYVNVRAQNAPVPPGLERLPQDGEVVVSPALAELLASPDGELLRPRFPQRVIGTIGAAGLIGPHDLKFYAGDSKIAESAGTKVYGYGRAYERMGLDPVLWMLSLVGIVVLLFPVLVFVGVATRLAAAQRDRRLAALRLVGAAAGRVRLIASGETLVGALTGLVFGIGFFFAVRPLAGEVPIPELAFFPGDLLPAPSLAAVVLVAVPVLAVLTSLFAMRRTIIEPLGVVRHQKPVRRRLWWRLVPVAGGIALLASQFGDTGEKGTPFQVIVITGVVLLMLGIPVLLPWLVERVANWMRGATPALQLAVRRLQLDAGTAARVVGGVAVVLAGTVTLQVILASVEKDVVSEEKRDATHNFVALTPKDDIDTAGLRTAVAGSKGVKAVHVLDRTYATDSNDRTTNVSVGTCAALKAQADVTDCVDGKAYRVRFARDVSESEAGEVLMIQGRTAWTLPALQEVPGTSPGIYLTPAAAKGIDFTDGRPQFQAELDLAVPDAAEYMRNSIADYTWRVHAYFVGQDDSAEVELIFGAIRRALLAGAVLTLLLAGASLLVMALEQVRERRRPLAVLAATGVPRGTLARSLLWQNGVPLVLSTVIAVGTGIGLGVMVTRVFNAEVAYDWPGIAALTVASVALVLAVTALTLPSLRKATGALGLQSE
ncbi:FtsX-like permease family protein [Lentzea sp. BCCO 10_0856]|uniref:FtsX-like permease family protein n=1 Tax=Lentzea miocenica TaxID=3095431 RepID=A0ABU4T953_9PSEU|nr:FtsX-like permease family protein [Lentzea sp. BCCO 10_0856]MDX8034584.1 FtsX-like permease family protein [Lentzea sp. BCCO 10_0856]